MLLKYSKNCKLDVLIDSLILNLLYDEFESIEMTEWQAGHDNIFIKLKRSFFSFETDQITKIINDYSATSEMSIRNSIEENVTTPAMIAGNKIMAKYSAMNVYKQKSIPQFFNIYKIADQLITYLLSGSLELALYEMSLIKNNLPADKSITLDECLEFERRLQIEIRIIKGK